MLRATLFLILVLSLTGCGSAPPNSPEETDPFPPTAQVESLGLPFDAYTLSLGDLYTISNAEDALMHRCMAARGYDWVVVDRPTDIKDLRNRRRYGVIESKIARFGYHVPAGLLSPISVEMAYDQRDAALGAEAQEAAFGPQGCGREVAARLRPDNGDDPNALTRKNSASLRDSQKDPRVAEVTNSWRSCMRGKGFDYPDPLAAMSDPAWWGDDSAPPSGREITVATADVDCKNKTGLVDVWHSAEVRLQQEEIDREPAYFQALRDAMNKQLALARGVLG